MARPRQSQPTEIPRPRTVGPGDGIILLLGQITKGQALLDSQAMTENEYDSWMLYQSTLDMS